VLNAVWFTACQFDDLTCIASICLVFDFLFAALLVLILSVFWWCW